MSQIGPISAAQNESKSRPVGNKSDSGSQNKSVVLDKQFHLPLKTLTESSGLAFSNRVKGSFWTHNDSGGRPQIFAFDRQGRPTGKAQLAVPRAIDWEDMSAFQEGKSLRLIVADSGDNQAGRSSILLHLFDEPNPSGNTRVDQLQTIRVRYPGGPRDCEGVAVDVKNRLILLFTKSFLPQCEVFAVELPEIPSRRLRTGLGQRKPDVVLARLVGRIFSPLITAADFDADRRELWICSYLQAYRFHIPEDWSSALSRPPDAFPLPNWKQIEALAIDRSHRVWVTSEGKLAPMGRLAETNSRPNASTTPQHPPSDSNH